MFGLVNGFGKRRHKVSKKRYTEYGLYIRKAKDDYVVGYVGAGPIVHFPTYDDAERAVENAIDQAWEFHGEDFTGTVIKNLI